MTVEITPVPWSSHREVLQHIRERVFILEQNVPRDLEWDGADDAAVHVLATTQAGQAVGCARLLPTGQVGRMAVLPEHRGQGLGERLLRAIIDEAAGLRMTRLFLHAQTHAEGFYLRAGFVPIGEVFTEAGIPHREMQMTLPVAAGQPRGEGACADELAGCIAQARRRLVIHSQQLDPLLFDRQPLIEAISRFARRAPAARLQVLINDSSRVVSRVHGLLELARRLPSSIEIRRVPEALQLAEPTFATWDDAGYFLMPDHRAYVAIRDHADAVRATRLGEQFARLWERSTADPELRLLVL